MPIRTEYPFNHAYAENVHQALRNALREATPGGLMCVNSIEATGAMLSLALETLTVEMPLDQAKQLIRDHLDNKLFCSEQAA